VCSSDLAVAVRPILNSQPPTWHYAAFIAIMAYARSIRMIGDRGRLLPIAFLLAPLYGVMNLLLLVPLRFYSLIRLRDGRWGTRRRRRGLRRGDAPDAAPVPDLDTGAAEMATLPSALEAPEVSAIESLVPRPRREASEQDLEATAALLVATAVAEPEPTPVFVTPAFTPPTGVRCVDIVPAQQERRGKARD